MVDTKEINGHTHVKYERETYDSAEATQRSKAFYEWINKRRTVRDISDRPVPIEIIENIIKTAGTAPSGAHKQPWKFCVVQNQEMKTEDQRGC